MCIGTISASAVFTSCFTSSLLLSRSFMSSIPSYPLSSPRMSFLRKFSSLGSCRIQSMMIGSDSGMVTSTS